MDQIHEELKVPVIDASPSANDNNNSRVNGGALREDASSSSLSEIEYETCDSGLSSGSCTGACEKRLIAKMVLTGVGKELGWGKKKGSLFLEWSHSVSISYCLNRALALSRSRSRSLALALSLPPP